MRTVGPSCLVLLILAGCQCQPTPTCGNDSRCAPDAAATHQPDGGNAAASSSSSGGAPSSSLASGPSSAAPSSSMAGSSGAPTASSSGPLPSSSSAGNNGSGMGVVFHSDWSTALGQSDAAMFDTSKPVPWDGFIGNGRANEVVSSTGLDFPSANVLAVNGSWRASPAGAAAQNHTLLTANGHIPVPAVGGSLFYRWYIRVTVPDSYTADPSTHPIEDSPGTGDQNWNFLVNSNTDGTWRATVQSGGNSFPDHRWSCPLLQKNVTYRVELQIHRISEMEFNFHARVYDAAGTLLYDDDDFRNANGSGMTTLAENPAQTIVNWANMAGFQCGFNGLAGGTESEFPFTLYYQGCFAISDTDWLGPYSDGI